MTLFNEPEAKKLSRWQPVRHAIPGWMLVLVAFGWALGPISAAWGSLAWLALCLAGLASLGLPSVSTPALGQAHRRWWWVSCAAFALAALAALLWRDPISSLQANTRLLLTAGAGWLLCTQLRPHARSHVILLHASTIAAAVATAIALIYTRGTLPFSTNAIPWAVYISFLACLLAPAALDAQQPKRLRLLWAAGTALALLAVLTTQTRGALVIVPWVGWLLVRHSPWRAYIGHRALVLTLVVTAVVALTSTAWLEADPLRLRTASQEVLDALYQGNPNTSVGARLYLWRTALEGIAQSPWLGHGSVARELAITTMNTQYGTPAWVGLGHFHNEYLNAWYDHGLLGLMRIWLPLLGLVWIAWSLPPEHRVTRQQLLGLAWMHGLAGMSNVNTAHNLYSLSLALAVALALIGASTRPKPTQ